MPDDRVIEVFEGKDGEWFLRLVDAGNHKTLSLSEGYASKGNALRAAESNFPDVPVRVED